MNQGLVQQVGTPTDIYDRPANTFVAGFIGSPAMNLMEGTLEQGVFTGKGVTIKGLSKKVTGPVTLGFRAEDSELTMGKAQISTEVYSMELLGEASMVTMHAGGALVSVKAAKDYRVKIGEKISAKIPAAICHLFDSKTGERVSV